MERADGDLWLKVLDESNKSRKSLVDQVVTALPESRNLEQVCWLEGLVESPSISRRGQITPSRCVV